jgi:hypothetical protein
LKAALPEGAALFLICANTGIWEVLMATRRSEYGRKKRQKEVERKRKREEKQQRKIQKKKQGNEEGT